MTIHHHPTDEILVTYAGGALNEALAIVVGAHVDVCGDCRKTVGLGTMLGGIFLESLPPAAVDADALEHVLSQLDSAPAGEKTKTDTNAFTSTLPPSLRTRKLGFKRRLAPGIWIVPILKDRAKGTRAYLLGAAAGKALLRHGHRGIELTQVIKGEFFDGEICYRAGDFLQADGDHAHRPTVGADQECICVIASEGVPRGLSGLLMRAFT